MLYFEKVLVDDADVDAALVVLLFRDLPQPAWLGIAGVGGHITYELALELPDWTVTV